MEHKKLTHPKKKKIKFNGETYLLTCNYTFSSANMLAIAFRCYEMGTVVGEETGGCLTAFGDVISFNLPNTQLRVNCSHKKFIHPCNDGKLHGVYPDIEIKPSFDDIQNDRDAVIEYLLK